MSTVAVAAAPLLALLLANVSGTPGCRPPVADRPSPTRHLTIREISQLPPADDRPPDEPLHGQQVHHPAGPPRIDAGTLDALGRPVTVSCASCHGNFDPNMELASSDELTEFHQGLTFDHGHVHSPLTCVSCHNPENYNLLKLADGRGVEFSASLTLCAQCHAPQARDFAHGAHGGMTGHWDLARGPQYRKTCIDCHDPHAPRFPPMDPTFRPLDRFLAPPHHGDHGHP